MKRPNEAIIEMPNEAIREISESQEPSEPVQASTPGRRFRLWHLTVAVLVSALLFGLLKRLIGPDPSARGFSLLIYGGVVLYSAVMMFGWVLRLGNRLAFRIIKHSGNREGLSSYLPLLLAALIHFISIVVSMALLIAAIGLLHTLMGP